MVRLINTFFHFRFLKSHLSIANVWVKLPAEFPRPLVHLGRQGGLFREKVKYYFAEINLGITRPLVHLERQGRLLGKRSNTILGKLICLNFRNY